jgi:hypothetical protein
MEPSRESLSFCSPSSDDLGPGPVPSEPTWINQLVAQAKSHDERVAVIGIGHPIRSVENVGSLVSKDFASHPRPQKKIIVLQPRVKEDKMRGVQR